MTIVSEINTENHVGSSLHFLIVLPTFPLTEKYPSMTHLSDYQADTFVLYAVHS